MYIINTKKLVLSLKILFVFFYKILAYSPFLRHCVPVPLEGVWLKVPTLQNSSHLHTHTNTTHTPRQSAKPSRGHLLLPFKQQQTCPSQRVLMLNGLRTYKLLKIFSFKAKRPQ